MTLKSIIDVLESISIGVRINNKSQEEISRELSGIVRLFNEWMRGLSKFAGEKSDLILHADYAWLNTTQDGLDKLKKRYRELLMSEEESQ